MINTWGCWTLLLLWKGAGMYIFQTSWGSLNRKLETWVRISSFVTCILCHHGNFHAFSGSIFPSVKWGVTSEICWSHSLCSTVSNCLWQLVKYYPGVKAEMIMKMHIKKNFHLFITCFSVCFVCTHTLFGLLSVAVRDLTRNVCAVPGFLEAGRKFSRLVFVNWIVMKLKYVPT